MLVLEDVKARAATERRTLIKPRVQIKTQTEQEKRQVVEVARKVIREHYDVLLALKDR